MAFIKINDLRTVQSAYAAYRAGVRFATIDLDSPLFFRKDETYIRKMMHLAPMHWIATLRRPCCLNSIMETLFRLNFHGLQVAPHLLTEKELRTLSQSPFHLWFSLKNISQEGFLELIHLGDLADSIEIHLSPILGEINHIAEFLENLPDFILNRLFIEGVRTIRGIETLSTIGPMGFSFSSLDMEKKEVLDVQRVALGARMLSKAQNLLRNLQEKEEEGENIADTLAENAPSFSLTGVETEWSYILKAL